MAAGTFVGLLVVVVVVPSTLTRSSNEKSAENMDSAVHEYNPVRLQMNLVNDCVSYPKSLMKVPYMDSVRYVILILHIRRLFSRAVPNQSRVCSVVTDTHLW